ncbi:hypothetical protein K466DRAFT_212947 [Polyporus arcularius HHB13444]|uniref:Uncharacterized protein n=1 Tax=Polyporus arcularius HHB13444 TaxID=1314778 RepID=A0A5C3P586_9APHY|nr:hypothetical protein K466DRAFT_212947 [Polyporus arcularius HHB13444]
MRSKAVSMLSRTEFETEILAQAAFGDLELLDGPLPTAAGDDGGSDSVLVRLRAQGATSILPTTSRLRRRKFSGQRLRSFSPRRRPLGLGEGSRRWQLRLIGFGLHLDYECKLTHLGCSSQGSRTGTCWTMRCVSWSRLTSFV